MLRVERYEGLGLRVLSLGLKGLGLRVWGFMV